MKYMKDITVMILAIGLMSLLVVIVVDEFMVAREHGGELDSSVIELLQMSITGIVGIVAGWASRGSN